MRERGEGGERHFKNANAPGGVEEKVVRSLLRTQQNKQCLVGYMFEAHDVGDLSREKAVEDLKRITRWT
jgi:hypothetical protein